MKIAIIGTGFAGFGALTALIGNPENEIYVLDIGLTERYPNQRNQIVPNAKEHKGSYYSYGINDVRWSVKCESQRICSSHAFGGHSTVYSGAILYPKGSDLDQWPQESRPTPSDYKEIINNIGVMHEEDELSSEFPLLPEDDDLLISKRNTHDSFFGLSRIAVEKLKGDEGFVRALFNTSTYFLAKLAEGKIQYYKNCYVYGLESNRENVKINWELDGGRKAKALEVDLVLVGAGCVNTTGIIDRSLFGEGERKYNLKCAGMFMDAFLKIRHNKHCNNSFRRALGFPEYFIESNSQLTKNTWMHSQISGINDQIIEMINLKIPLFGKIIGRALKNILYFSITVIHSKYVEPVMIKCSSVRDQSNGSFIHFISVCESNSSQKYISFRAAFYASIKSHWMGLGMIRIPLGGLIGDVIKGNRLGSWHFGGTIPMVTDPCLGQCLPTGEVLGLKGVYIIDSAAFPSVPGSTVALLIAANAHRVARGLQTRTNNLGG